MRVGIVEDAIRAARASTRPVKPGMCECRSGLRWGECDHRLGTAPVDQFPCADRHTSDTRSEDAILRRLESGWEQERCPVCDRYAVWRPPGTSRADAEQMLKAEAIDA